MQNSLNGMTLSSIMKNPALKRILIDAYNAPIGSTKRDQARETINSFQKIFSKKFDGQGGAPSISPAFFTAPEQSQPAGTNSYNNVRIFPGSPSPSVGQPKEYKQDGQGGPLDLSGWGNYSLLNPSNVTGLTPSNTPILKNNNNNILGNSGLKTTNANGINENQLKSGWQANQKNQTWSNLLQGTGNSAITANPETFGASIDKNKLKNLLSNIKSGTSSSLATPTPAPKNAPTENKKVTPTPINNQPTNVSAGTTGNTNVSTATSGKAEGPQTAYASNPTLQAQWDALSSAQKVQYKPVFDAAASKVGAGTFFLGAMADKSTLKKLFPGIKDEDLPTGASLSGQLADLEDTLKKENNLDSLLNQKTQLANQQNDFKQDVTDYISGRDQYLGQINNMIDKAERQKIDNSDPYAVNSLNNYTNYLYVLKGRQNKNYVDYLNSAVDHYNTQVQNAETAYQNAVNNYNTEFATKKDITTEQYNDWKTILTDMYNKLDGAESAQLDKDYKQAQIDQVRGSILNDSINAQVNVMNANTNAQQVANAASKVTNWLTQEGDYSDYIVSNDTKTKGQLLPGVDLASVMSRAVSAGLQPQGVLDKFQMGASQSINASNGDANSLSSSIQNASDILKNFNTATKGQYSSQTAAMAQSVANSASNQLAEYIGNNANDISKAIKDLGKKGNTTADTFAYNHPNLNYNVAAQLFNYYKNNPEYYNKPAYLFSNNGDVSSSKIDSLKTIIGKSIANAWANSLVSDTSYQQ